MNVISYCRVSTDIQDYDRQIKDIRDYCLKFNYTIVKEFSEKQSGKIKQRPVLSEMESYINENYNNIDYLIISELSRLGRSSYVQTTLEFLNEKKVGLISLKETIITLNEDKTVNYTSGLILSILSGINSYELETIKYRSISGIKNSIKIGNAGGSSNFPYGYKKEGKLLVIDSEESIIIEEIFNLYLNGNGTTKICNILIERNILTRTSKTINQGLNKKIYNFSGVWSDSVIYSILKNPIYIGKRRYKNELFDQPQLKIIEMETFDRVQQLLKSNNNKVGKHTKFSYLLDNMKIKCGICGRSYFPHKRQNNKDNRYICLSKRYKNKSIEDCGNYGISIDKIENLIQSVILYRFNDILKTKLNDTNFELQIKNIQEDILIINSEINVNNKNEELMIDLYLKTGGSTMYEKKIKEIKNQHINLINKLNLKETELIDLKNTYDNIRDIKQLKIKFNNDKQKLDKGIVNTIIKKIIITKQDSFPDVFKNRQDKIVKITIFSGDRELNYLISQREKYIYDLQLNKFMNRFYTSGSEEIIGRIDLEMSLPNNYKEFNYEKN